MSKPNPFIYSETFNFFKLYFPAMSRKVHCLAARVFIGVETVESIGMMRDFHGEQVVTFEEMGNIREVLDFAAKAVL